MITNVKNEWSIQHTDALQMCPPVDYINTIKDKLHVTFMSFRIILYPVILGVNLPDLIEISGEVHLQVRYKASVT
jgi:hypothetical protein